MQIYSLHFAKMTQIHEDIDGTEHTADHKGDGDDIETLDQRVLLFIHAGEVDEDRGADTHLIENLYNGIDPNGDCGQFGQVRLKEIFEAIIGTIE